MKTGITLINPFIPSLSWFFYAQGMSTPPLGMLSVAEKLNRENLETFVIDGQRNYEPPEDTLERVIQYAPRVVAVMPAPVLHLYTFMANTAFPYHLAFLRALKKRLPEVITVLGGLLPRQKSGIVLSKENSVDIVILSSHPTEAANSISALAKGKPLDEIPGIAFRDKSGAPKINEKKLGNSTQLDAIPDLTLQRGYNVEGYGIDKNLYLVEERKIYPVYPVIGMLGCPFRCTFCATPLHFPKPSTSQSPTRFADTIEQAVVNSKVSRFSFWDDTFTRHPAWVTDICNHIIKRKLDIQWWCFGKVEWVLKHRELLLLMRRAGCTMMWIGVESTEDDHLDTYNKEISFSMAKDAVDALVNEEILPTNSFILGNINDDLDKTKKIVALSRELEVRGAINIYTLLVPVPGTKLFESVQKEKLLKCRDLRLFNGTRALLEYPGMPAEVLEEIFFDSYKHSVLGTRFQTNVGRTNFNLEPTPSQNETKLLDGFEKEKKRMLTLEQNGYLDDGPQQIASSCEWVFDN